MSVAAMVSRMGVSAGVRRCTYARSSIGTMDKTFTTTLTVVCFVQERGSSAQVAQGRDNMRSSTVIYFVGSVDVRADDVIAVPPTGATCVMYRVNGVRVPDLATSHPNCHTIVDATKVPPTELVPT